ncbi:MAG: hypothetical protein JW891_02720 [Candidatus Lokiarchaeota archaeon]|nr:hypothetical protein [Candidatus Lokiarchaeota archaeon]
MKIKKETVENMINNYFTFRLIESLVKSIITARKKLLNRKKKKKYEECDVIVVNLSGRKFNEDALKTISQWGKIEIVEIEPATLDLTNPASYMQVVGDYCAEILDRLVNRESLVEILATQKCVIVPPGLNSTAIMFTTMLHGMTGHFPIMSFFYEKDNGYDLTPRITLQSIRNHYRDVQTPVNQPPSIEEDLVFLNLARHELSDEALHEISQWKGYKKVTRATPSLDLTNPLTYHETVKDFCVKTIDDVINLEGVLRHLKIGKYAVLPAGLSSIGIIYTVLLHGLCGHFPRASFFYRAGSVYSLTRPFDFQEIRTKFIGS